MKAEGGPAREKCFIKNRVKIDGNKGQKWPTYTKLNTCMKVPKLRNWGKFLTKKYFKKKKRKSEKCIH